MPRGTYILKIQAFRHDLISEKCPFLGTLSTATYFLFFRIVLFKLTVSWNQALFVPSITIHQV